MAEVVPIRPGLERKQPAPDKDLIAYLEKLLEDARAGEIQALVVGVVVREECDNWHFSEEGWVPQVCYSTRLVLNELESPFE